MANIAIAPTSCATLNKHRKVPSEASTSSLPILANHAVVAEFEAACQTGVSAFSPINVHAKLEVEARFASSTVLPNMHGLNSELQGFDSSLSAVVANEDITAPPPVYI